MEGELEPGAAAIASSIHDLAIRFVRFVWTDNAGLIRAKAVHAPSIGEYVDGGGVGITPAVQALPVMYDALSQGSGLTPVGEVHMRADWGTLRPLPYAVGHARVFADIYDGDEPWKLCPRGFLRRMIDRAHSVGLSVKAAFEDEFYLLRPEPNGGWTPVDTSVFAQTSALDRMAVELNAIAEALEAQGLMAEQCYAESGPGQFEMPIRYADALTAADNQVVFRETVRAVAAQHGLIASFLPKIFEERAGTGAHLHLSVWRGEHNLMGDVERPAELGQEARPFIAGILAHLPALVAITTPTSNSFKRIRPRFWSGAFVSWGYGNKEASVRVPPASRYGKPITNVELKTVDSSCNPYLAIGAVIAAGLDGMARGLTLGEPIQLDPADLSPDEQAAFGISALPSNLGDAITELEKDAVLAEALGSELLRSFLAVRRAEWEAFRDMPHDEEVKLLLERY
ncbi:MAG: Glutamate--ammonia ligase [Chloroflexi bacterium]|nr:Glutamate--ammonia ligase [Chloroflexota bacterium]